MSEPSTLLLEHHLKVLKLPTFVRDYKAVSYTHLDVYKRQASRAPTSSGCTARTRIRTSTT